MHAHKELIAHHVLARTDVMGVCLCAQCPPNQDAGSDVQDCVSNDDCAYAECGGGECDSWGDYGIADTCIIQSMGTTTQVGGIKNALFQHLPYLVLTGSPFFYQCPPNPACDTAATSSCSSDSECSDAAGCGGSSWCSTDECGVAECKVSCPLSAAE